MLFGSKKNSYLTIEGSTVTDFEEFSCKDRNVILPEYITVIGDGAFANSSVNNINFPRGLTRIGRYAFSKVWGLTDVTLPYGVRYIDEGAFSGCRDLERIFIPDSVEYIGPNVFQDCHNLRSVRLPSGIKEIPAAAFERCYSLLGVDIPVGVEYIRAFAFSHSGIRSMAIPRSVRNIAAQHLFAGCNDLGYLNISSGFRHIEHLLELPSCCEISYY